MVVTLRRSFELWRGQNLAYWLPYLSRRSLARRLELSKSSSIMYKKFLLFLSPFIFFLIGFLIMSIVIQEKAFKVPLLLGHSVVYALNEATRQGFTLKLLAQKDAPDVAAGTVIIQKPQAGSFIKPKQAVLITVAAEPVRAEIPTLAGLKQEQWQPYTQDFKITEHHLTHSLPLGMVIAQSPAAGERYDHESLTLYVAHGPETRRIVPNLCGYQVEQVQEFLEGYGITCTLFEEHYDPRRHAHFEPGMIIAQKPIAGSWIDLKKPSLVQLVVVS